MGKFQICGGLSWSHWIESSQVQLRWLLSRLYHRFWTEVRSVRCTLQANLWSYQEEKRGSNLQVDRIHEHSGCVSQAALECVSLRSRKWRLYPRSHAMWMWERSEASRGHHRIYMWLRKGSSKPHVCWSASSCMRAAIFHSCYPIFKFRVSLHI